MPVSTLLIIVLVLVLIGAAPTWPYSREWSYRPFSLITVILIVLLVLVMTHRI